MGWSSLSDEKQASFNMDRAIVTRVDGLIAEGGTYATSRSGFFRACVEGHLRVGDSLSTETLAYKWAEKQLYVELIQLAAPWKLRHTVQALGGIDRLLNIHSEVQKREEADIKDALRGALLTSFKVPDGTFDPPRAK